MWRPQLKLVPDGFRFIAPDLRSFGESDVEAGPLPTMDDYAADIARLLDALGIERARYRRLVHGRIRDLRVPPATRPSVLRDGARRHAFAAGHSSRPRGPSCDVRTRTNEGRQRRCDQMIPQTAERNDAAGGIRTLPRSSGR